MRKNCVMCGTELETTGMNQKYCVKCRKKVKAERDKNYQLIKKKPVAKKNCLICGKEFVPVKGNQIYCSKECYIKAYIEHRKLRRNKIPILRNCANCGKEFTVNKYNKNYCSVECRDIAKKEKVRESNEAIRNRRVKVKCKWCEKEFETKNANFCSETCLEKFRHAKKRTGIEMTEAEYKEYRSVTCALCGDVFIPVKRAREGSVVCPKCAKKYRIRQYELPNMCSVCGKVIREGKALCKDCYEKATWRYDVKMVDFKGVKVYE